jgi:hypothetical protein
MRINRWLPAVVAAWRGVVAYSAAVRDSKALPSFARKYRTSFGPGSFRRFVRSMRGLR